LFGKIGDRPEKIIEIDTEKNQTVAEKSKEVIDDIGEIFSKNESEQSDKNPFTRTDKILTAFCGVIGLLFAFYDPIKEIGNFDLFPFNIGPLSGKYVVVLIGLVAFSYLVTNRVLRYSKIVRDRIVAVIIFAIFTVFFWMSFEQGATSLVLFARDSVDRALVGDSLLIFNIFDTILTIAPLLIITWVLILLARQTFKIIPISNIVLAICFLSVWGIVIWKIQREFSAEASEITVSWFSILNSFFIIAFASIFSKWWDSKYNPSAAGKYALGLIIMAIGFGLLAFGAYGIEAGVKVSMAWLILAYLFHTLGELCLSPLGLSYVSKLVPPRMIAFMFGMWYLAIAIGNKLAASLGGQIESITEEYSLSAFFLIFTIVPIVAGILVYLLNPLLKRLMHGVK